MLPWKTNSTDWETTTPHLFIILRPSVIKSHYHGDIFLRSTPISIPIPDFYAPTPDEAQAFVEHLTPSLLQTAIDHLSQAIKSL